MASVPSARSSKLGEFAVAGRIRDLDVRREADPEADKGATGAATSLLFAQLVDARGFECELECSRIVAGVVSGPGRGYIGKRGDEVTVADGRRIESGLVGEHVQRALDRLSRLRASCAPILRDRSRIRDHGARRHGDARDRVRPGGHQLREGRQGRADAGIRAGIGKDVELIGLQPPVSTPAEPEVELLASAVVESDHALATRLRPADRPPQSSREPGDEDFLDPEELGAEGPADVWIEHANFPLAHPQDALEGQLVRCGVCVVSQTVSRPSESV